MASKTAAEDKNSQDIKIEDLIAKTSINKYDPFQLKSSIDEEIVTVTLSFPITCQLVALEG